MAPHVRRDHAVALAQGPERGQPVQARARDPAVQEEHGGGAGRTGQAAHERGSATGQRQALARRESRLCRQARHHHLANPMAGLRPLSACGVALASRRMTTLDATAVDALLARARRDVDDGLLPACQVALALDGEVLVHEAFGEADVDTRFTIFSATKPFIASLIWQLLGEGALRPEQPVHDVIPEFGSHGKDAITLDHVLQHTAGLPAGSPRPTPLGHARRPPRGLQRVAAQLGGRVAVRVPPHVRALGAGRARPRRHGGRSHRRPAHARAGAARSLAVHARAPARAAGPDRGPGPHRGARRAPTSSRLRSASARSMWAR